jgi:hypothetical protein
MAHQLRAQSIIGFAPLVTELGGDALQLLRNAGLDPAELEQPDIYISCIAPSSSCSKTPPTNCAAPISGCACSTARI